MFRCTPIFPLLLSIAGFVLGLLVLLAGKDPKTLTDVFVLRVDTTNIGQNMNLDSVLSHLGIDKKSTNISFIDDAVSSLSDDVKKAIGNAVNTAAHEVGLQDVYTAHVMTYCTGLRTGTAEDNRTITTACTHPEIPFSFDPMEILRQDLLAGVSLEDLGFPTDKVQPVVHDLQTAYRAQSICYVIGIALAGLSILLGLSAFIVPRVPDLLNCIICILSFLALGIASGVTTTIAVKGRDVFNEYAQPVGVYAYLSIKFLGLTWGAVAAMLFAGIAWGAVCCIPGNRRRRNVDEGPLVEKRERYV